MCVVALGCGATYPAAVAGANGDGVEIELLSGEKVTIALDDGEEPRRVQVAAANPRGEVVYEGVWLAELLGAAGVEEPAKIVSEVEQKFGSAEESATAAEEPLELVIVGDDGYRVVFSADEIWPASGDGGVLLADRKDGNQLGDAGPYQIVLPGAANEHRWVRRVVRIKIQKTDPRGRVYLVGIGPGDPGLVTDETRRIVQASDHVFCFDYLETETSRLTSDGDALEIVPFSVMGQENQQERRRLAAQVRRLVFAGQSVVFCAAGDPTIFCPWSWILDDLADLEPTVLPGISSFNSGSAALRQNLFRASGSVVLSDGRDLGGPDEDGRLSRTMVFFTHVVGLEQLVPRLLERYPAETPVAVVADAGHAGRQRVVAATLATIVDEVELAGGLPHLYLVFAGDSLEGLSDKHSHPPQGHPHSHSDGHNHGDGHWHSHDN